MAAFDKADAILASAQFATFSDPGYYDGSAEPNCRVIVDTETIWLEGEESSSAREQVTVTFELADVNPARGKTVVVNGTTYELGARLKTTTTEAVHLVSR